MNCPVTIDPIIRDMLLILEPHVKRVSLKRGEKLLDIGQICEYMGVVTKGNLRMYYIDKKGNDISFLFFLTTHLVTNYESVLTETPSQMIIEATEASEITLLHKNDVFKLYQSSAKWQEAGRLISDQIFLKAKQRIDTLLFLSPEERYIDLLNNQPEILQQIPQKHIATYLGIQPQSLSRIRKRMNNDSFT